MSDKTVFVTPQLRLERSMAEEIDRLLKYAGTIHRTPMGTLMTHPNAPPGIVLLMQDGRVVGWMAVSPENRGISGSA